MYVLNSFLKKKKLIKDLLGSIIGLMLVIYFRL